MPKSFLTVSLQKNDKKQIMDTVLKIEHISKTYTGHRALDDVSMEIPRGSIYGLLGPNGAGKTTLIRVVNRMILPDSGKVFFEDREITAEDIYRIGYIALSNQRLERGF